MANFSEMRRILLVKLSSFGDVVHFTSCLKSVRRSFPNAEIIMAVESLLSPVVKNNPSLDTVIESNAESHWPLQYALGVCKELSGFRDRPFDMAIDFQGTGKSAVWVYSSRGKVKTGRGKIRPGWKMTCQPDLSKHAVLVCAEIARAVGMSVADPKPEIFISEHEDKELTEILYRFDIPSEGFIIINPFSRWPSKAWPLERYAALIRRVLGNFGLPVVITGNKAEEKNALELRELVSAESVKSLVGRLSLGQALCLYRRGAIMVTGDTGPMHAAAALGTKTVALFGPTFPERTGPWGDGHKVVQLLRPQSHHEYRADPVGKYIGAIDVETVYNAVESCLV